MIAWRLDVQNAAGDWDDAAKPLWSNDVPYCSMECPYRGPNGCKLTYQRISVCEPVVAQMGKMLTAGPK